MRWRARNSWRIADSRCVLPVPVAPQKQSGAEPPGFAANNFAAVTANVLLVQVTRLPKVIVSLDRDRLVCGELDCDRESAAAESSLPTPAVPFEPNFPAPLFTGSDASYRRWTEPAARAPVVEVADVGESCSEMTRIDFAPARTPPARVPAAPLPTAPLPVWPAAVGCASLASLGFGADGMDGRMFELEEDDCRRE